MGPWQRPLAPRTGLAGAHGPPNRGWSGLVTLTLVSPRANKVSTVRVTLLSSLASKECNAILREAAEERTELEYRREQLLRIQTLGSGRTAELAEELANAQEEFDDLTTRIPNLPVGEKKRKVVTEQKRLGFRVSALADRQLIGDLGVMARFRRIYELNCIALQLTENDTLKTEVEARHAAL